LPEDIVSLVKDAGFTPWPADRATPALAVRGVEGEDISLDRLRGKLILIVFWGTSCAPCLREFPDLERLAARFRGEGLQVVPVCADESDSDIVKRVAGECAPRLPVYVDPTGRAKLSYDVQAMPAASLIAPDGRCLGYAQGSIPWSAPEVDSLIRATLPAVRSR
jgi:thiol-disulfide isomerase/thioredoxin